MQHIFPWKKNLRIILSVLLILEVTFPSVGFADPQRCVGALKDTQELSRIEQERAHWLKEAHSAHLNENWNGMTYSLLRTAQLEPHRYLIKYHEKKLLRDSLLVLEASSFQQEFEAQSTSVQKYRKVLNFLGLQHLFQRQVFGVKPFSQRAQELRGARSLAWDMFFVVGPALLSHLRVSDLRGDSSKNILRQILEKVVQDYRQQFSEQPSLGISDLTHNLFQQISPQIPNSWTWGRILSPLMMAMGVLVTTGHTPGALISGMVKQSLPYEYNYYYDREYLRDIEMRVSSLKDGKNLIVYSDSLFPSIDDRPKPPLATPGLKDLDGPFLNLVQIKTIADLKRIPYQNYDNVIILSHGQPDDLAVGLNVDGLPKMKKGANLILFACLVGQKGGGVENEQWVKFSQQVLDGGKSFAATQAIGTILRPDDAGPTMSSKGGTEQDLLDKGLSAILHLAGVYPVIVGTMEASYAISNDYYFSPKGIRMYDSATNTLEYYPSLPLIENKP